MMLRFWIPLTIVYGKDTGKIQVDSNKNCQDLIYFDNEQGLGYSMCEKFCITHDCKRCRMVCLSRECQDQPYATTKRDCRVHEFLSTNCSKATLFKDNDKGAIKSIKIVETCEVFTGFLTLSRVMAGEKPITSVDLERCGKTLVKSPWLFELKGYGTGHINFATREFSKTTNAFEETLRIAVILRLVQSVIDLRLFLDSHYQTTVPLQEKNFWIDILRFKNGSAIFCMGQGSLVGQDTLFNVSPKGSQLAEFVRLIVTAIEGNLN